MEKTPKPGRPKSEEKSTPIQIRVGDRLLAKIDNAFHARRLPSRAETIRALLAESLGMKNS
jgi:metal-responsive CopG/Arc/MetJ family transcriptional regulator